MKATQVYPVTDLKTRAGEMVREVSESGESYLITQNGRPKAVLMDAKEHDRLQETLAMLKLLAQSQDSLARGEKPLSGKEARRRAHAVLERLRKG
jgi:prevent-host-death family protein